VEPTKKDIPSSFVSIDFETLYSQRVSACSIGMVKYRDGKKVDQYYSLIRPPFDYPGKSGQVLTWVHGISEDDVRNEKTFAELLPEIENFVGGLPLVAHNASVEKCCIRDVCAYYEIETKLDYNNILDTLPLSREAEAKVGIQVEGQGTHSLDAVCSRFNVPVLNHHNALEDAEMCGNLMVKFREILVEGKPLEKATPVREKTNTVKEDIEEAPSVDKIIQTPSKGNENSKSGCLGIMVIGIILSSIIAFI
jgi:DNA polymerase-3 subunit epsilon